MAINDALLSYLEEYENNSSNNENASKRQHSVLDVVEDLNSAGSDVLNITNDSKNASVEKVVSSPEQVEEISNIQKKNTTFNFRLNVVKKQNDQQESNRIESSSLDIMNDISSEVIASQPMQSQHSEVSKEDNTSAKQKEKPVEEKPKRDNSDTINKMDQLLAMAREKAKNNSLESEEDNEKSVIDKIHEMEGVTPKTEEEPEHRTIEGKPKIDHIEERIENNLQEEVGVEELINRAQTHYKDEWIEVYEKGMRSRKNNEFTNKVRKGRFRIDQNHQIEILPDKRTDNKDLHQLLREKWL